MTSVKTFGVFWDIENFVYHRDENTGLIVLEKKLATARLILEALPKYMQGFGFAPVMEWHLVFANRKLPPQFSLLLLEYGYHVYLTRSTQPNAADIEFHKAVKGVRKGRRPPLPDHMCLITGDNGFFRLIQNMRRLQCQEVWGFNWSRQKTGMVLIYGNQKTWGFDKFVSFGKLIFGEEIDIS